MSRLSILVVPLLGLAACGGGGSSGPVTPPPAGSTVVVSGKITFDRIPFKATNGTGLNPAAPVQSPARQVIVEAVDAGNNSVLASTSTDTAGDYSLTVPASRNLFIRARAQMLKTGTAPTWNFTVRNNTNADALYVLDSASFNSGNANSGAHDLRAASGWNGTSYTSTRAAAPFAVLDTVYQAKELVLTAAATAEFPALNLFWSVNNRPTVGPFCPDDGDIGVTSYVVFSTTPPDNVDGCGQPGVNGIYIQGDFNSGDTDEFDQHVIAHEFGHYFEDQFSRSDSMGGQHGPNDRLDLRVAFGEGWGNAYSAMSLNDPVYRDSRSGMNSDFFINLDTAVATFPGWFSETSVGKFLWDVFDGGTESGDTVALGFTPIYAVMTGAQRTTAAMTSIYSFATALRSANASAASGINALLNAEAIDGTDAFGAGETNNGGGAIVLPIYQPIALNTPLSGVCSLSVAGSKLNILDLDVLNKLGNRVLLRFDNDASRTVTIQAVGQQPNPQSVQATDPDIFVWQAGVPVASGESVVLNSESIAPFLLPAGTTIIEVYDFHLTGTNQPPRCMQVSIAG